MIAHPANEFQDDYVFDSSDGFITAANDFEYVGSIRLDRMPEESLLDAIYLFRRDDDFFVGYTHRSGHVGDISFESSIRPLEKTDFELEDFIRIR